MAFDWAGLFGKAVETGLPFARAAGMKLPLDSEINSLAEKSHNLKVLSARLDDVLAKGLPVLQRTGTAMASLAAKNLRNAARTAQAQARKANGTLDSTIKLGRSAQETVKYGRSAVKVIASFMLRKNAADQVYNGARLRLERVIQNWQAQERQLYGTSKLPSSVPGGYFPTTGTVGRVTRGVVDRGERAVTSAAGFLEGLPPWAVPAAFGLVALSIVMRPSRERAA